MVICTDSVVASDPHSTKNTMPSNPFSDGNTGSVNPGSPLCFDCTTVVALLEHLEHGHRPQHCSVLINYYTRPYKAY